MGIIRFAIDNPVKVTVGVFLLVLFGLLSLFATPVQLTPNVDRPIVTVSTFWEGASPQEIEREIVERQEEKLKSVSNLRQMTSSSTEGLAEIELEFHVGVDKDAALRDVSDKLRQVTGYPQEVDEPTIKAADSALDAPIAWLIFFGAPGEDTSTLRDFVEDEVKPILERAEGVAEVNVYGGREREVQVRVDAALLASRGITFRDLENALRLQNENTSAGTISSGKHDTTWRTVGQFESLDEVLDTVVGYRNGVPVYVREVAGVHHSFKKQRSFVRSVGHPVLALPVRRESGSNVIEVMANLKVQIEKVNRDVLVPLNRELRLTQVYDETTYIHSAIDLVLDNVWQGTALTIIVLLFYLRSPSATGIISLTIPISVIGSFLIVWALGRTMNVIMLAGMAFAVGMVVDNAIVLLENIYRHQQMGKPRRQAALEGSMEVWGAVLATTLTASAVFLPVIFIEEEIGQLFRDIAIAISAAVILSLVVAIVVIPPVAAKWLKASTSKAADHRESKPAQYTAWLVYKINGSYLARIGVCTLLVVVSLVGSAALMPPTDYLPAGNRNLVFGYLITPPGYSLAEYQRMGDVIEELISPYWDMALAMKDTPENEARAQKLRAELDARWNTQVVPRFEQALTAAEQRYQQARSRMKRAETTDAATAAELNDAEAALLHARTELASHRIAPPPIENFFFVSFGGGCFMGATSRDPEVVRPLVNLLTLAGQRIPGTFAFFNQTSLFSGVRGSGNSIELQIRGAHLEAVTRVASALFGEIMQYFGPPRPEPGNFNLGRPEVQIVPDRVRAAEVGLNVRDVGQIVEACVDGALVPGGFRDHGDEIDLAIVVEGLDRATPQEISQLPVYTPIGQVIQIGSVVTLTDTTAPQQIDHIEELPAVTLLISPPADRPLEEATTTLNEKIIAPMRARGVIPSDVFTAAAGNARKLDETRAAMFGRWSGWNWASLWSLVMSRGGLAVLITYLLMAALFESFAYPLVIMFSVVPATVGGFAALRIVHSISAANPLVPTQNLDVLTMLGFVILVGIVVSNAILLVHQTLINMRENGMAPREAISDSVRTRWRPIFMTAWTTITGLIPLVIMPGPGSELYRGLGAVVLGGLLVSTIFTLVLIPALFSLFVDVQQIVTRRLVKSTRRPAPLPQSL